MGNFLDKLERQAQKDEELRRMQAFFSKLYPQHFLNGQYTLLNKLVLMALPIVLLYAKNNPILEEVKEVSLNNPFSETTAQKIRFVASIYGLVVMYFVKKQVGLGVFSSYTMQSWTWTTLRFCLSFLAAASGNSVVAAISEKTRFISLVQNTVTFTVWWFILFPVLTAFLGFKNPQQAKDFVKWNFSPFLLTVHGINLPFALLGHLLEPRVLKYSDLWTGWAAAMVYLTFYLLILDRIKLPLYIILSPRSNIGAVGYFVWMKVNEYTPGWLELLNGMTA
eukprot:snap_masked-scaffold_1-processed-gene-31.19-mRNA-1 protein AED:1.00 eAED:1.00 QI:0/0/0/0/1/1/2/0/278